MAEEPKEKSKIGIGAAVVVAAAALGHGLWKPVASIATKGFGLSCADDVVRTGAQAADDVAPMLDDAAKAGATATHTSEHAATLGDEALATAGRATEQQPEWMKDVSSETYKRASLHSQASARQKALQKLESNTQDAVRAARGYARSQQEDDEESKPKSP